jgi:hypothetical protein
MAPSVVPLYREGVRYVQRARQNALQDDNNMQVLLRRSNFRQDIQCSVCGQGFRLYWELRSASERATMRSIVIGELREHHSREQGGDKTAAAHPVDLFRLPTWLGSPEFSRSTLLASPESRIHRAARRTDYISE